ncbi:MAG: hypothetical protein ACOC6C_01780 [Verrucomicrobiota bacterium]
MKCKKAKQSMVAGNDGVAEREHMEQCSHCSGLKTLVGDMEEAGRRLRSVEMSEFSIARTRSEVDSALHGRRKEAAALQKESIFGALPAQIYAVAAFIMIVAAVFMMTGPMRDEGEQNVIDARPVGAVSLSRQIDALRLKIERDMASLSGQLEEAGRSSYLERARDELKVEMAVARARIDNITGGNRL